MVIVFFSCVHPPLSRPTPTSFPLPQTMSAPHEKAIAALEALQPATVVDPALAYGSVRLVRGRGGGEGAGGGRACSDVPCPIWLRARGARPPMPALR
jgi:hypothetical protein